MKNDEPTEITRKEMVASKRERWEQETEDSKERALESFLKKPEVHEKWIQDYRTENQRHYERAFDYITSILKPLKILYFLMKDAEVVPTLSA